MALRFERVAMMRMRALEHGFQHVHFRQMRHQLARARVGKPDAVAPAVPRVAIERDAQGPRGHVGFDNPQECRGLGLHRLALPRAIPRRHRTVVSQTVRISKLALPWSRIDLRSSYSAKLSGRKLKGCMTTSKGAARLLGTAHRMTQYSLATGDHAQPALPNANHVMRVSFSVRTNDFCLPSWRRKKDT